MFQHEATHPKLRSFPTRRSSDLPVDARSGAWIASMGGTERRLHPDFGPNGADQPDRKSTRLNSSHANTSYAVFCLKKKIRNGPVRPTKTVPCASSSAPCRAPVTD